MKEIIQDLFELIEHLIWMHNVNSTYLVEERLKELEEIRKKFKRLKK